MSWDQNTAAITCPSTIELAVWSPCDRFIAITWGDATTVDVLDSVTLQRLQTFEYPRDVSIVFIALGFSPDSRILSAAGYWDGDFVVSWDLQTGGVTSVVRWEGQIRLAEVPSITYSANGKMVGVFYWYRMDPSITILTSNVTSGVCVDHHSIDGGIPLSKDIWACGGSLRFATAGATTITIWEVGVTSGATPTEVETLPLPDSFNPTVFPYLHYDDINEWFRFLPAPCRLALAFEDKVTVWDVRNSKCLLHCTDTEFFPNMSFSSDGRFFACSTTRSEVYLWKESPTGYILHDKLAVFSTVDPIPLLSPNGESIVVFGDRTIRLWHTKSLTTPPSNILTQAPQRARSFVLDFSPDGTLAVIARQRDDTVTVLNLKSGIPQLTIDASIGVCGLRVIGNTVVVIGAWKAITWNLPAGDFVPDARVGIEDSSWTINFPDGDRELEDTLGASISSNSRRIALIARNKLSSEYLLIYDTSTGWSLGRRYTMGHTPRFSPDGYNIWCANRGEAEVWRIGGWPVLKPLEQAADIEDPQKASPWGSSLGYRVTNDWWILGPDGKRLLMLPPPWQSDAVQRVWKGRFLALLHGGLPETVILELDQ